MYISTPHLKVNSTPDDSRVSPSSLVNFADCPYYYWAKRIAKFWVDDPKDYFDIGSGADSLITIGQEHYDIHYRVIPKRTQALKEEAKEMECCSDEDCRDGVTLLAPKQAKLILGMKKELERQPLFSKLNCEGMVTQKWLETDIVDEFDGSKVHAVGKLDYYHKGGQLIADLKTTANLDTFHPARYTLQMGFYHEVAKIVDGIDAQVFIVAVDKTDMTRSRIYMVSEHVIAEGKRRMFRAIEQLKLCRESNAWLDQILDDDKPHECPTYDSCPYAIQKRIFII